MNRSAIQCLMLVIIGMSMVTGNAQGIDMWLGTAASGGAPAEGIYATTLDTETGRLGNVRQAARIEAPGFLALHPVHDVLYSIARKADKGIVAAYQIQDAAAGSTLQPLNQITNPAGRATHLAVDRTGTLLLTAQYGAGSTALFTLTTDGAIGQHVTTQQHQGAAGVVPNRQEAPHAHWVGTSPDNRFVLVPDLGLDKILIYRLQTQPPGLAAHGHGVSPSGAGPRHMRFHPNDEFIYVANELAVSVTAYRYDSAGGTMDAVQTITSVSPEQQTAERAVSASEIVVHPSGRFVYVANRGHDTLSAFAVDPQTHTLRLVQQQPVRGANPRHFTVDPTGRWLIVANRDSNNLTVFEIDADSGRLTYTGQSAYVPSPICVIFGRAAD